MISAKTYRLLMRVVAVGLVAFMASCIVLKLPLYCHSPG